MNSPRLVRGFFSLGRSPTDAGRASTYRTRIRTGSERKWSSRVRVIQSLGDEDLQFWDLVVVVLFGGEVEAGHSRLPLKIVASAWFERDDNLLFVVGRIGISALR